jgi:hypothetical protein
MPVCYTLHCNSIFETQIVYILRVCRRRAQFSDVNLKIGYLYTTVRNNFTIIAVFDPASRLSVANCSA